MILKSLRCTNFKRLNDHTFNFTAGLNVVVGENGEGKSTLLQAIDACLFGLSVVPGKKEHLMTWGQPNFSLVLKFEADGKAYELTRTKSTAKLLGGDHVDSLLANGHTPVTEAIRDLLGLSYQDWSLLVHSHQGETAGVLTFGAAALSRRVEAFSGADVIDSVASLAGSRAGTRQAYAEAYAVGNEAILEAESSVKDAQAKVNDLISESECARHRLGFFDIDHPMPERPNKTIDELREQQVEASRSETRLKVAQRKLEGHREELKGAQADLEELGERMEGTGLESEVAWRVEEIRTRKAAFRELDKELNDARGRLYQLEKLEVQLENLGSPDGDEVVLTHELTTKEAALDELTTRCGSLGSRLEDTISLLQNAACPTCGASTGCADVDALAAQEATLRIEHSEAMEQRTALVAEVKDIRSRLAKAKAHNTEVERLLAEKKKVEATLMNVEVYDEKCAELTDLEKYLADHEETLKRVRGQLAALEERNSGIARAERRVNRTAAEVAEAQREVEAAQAAVVAAPSEEEFKQLNAEWMRYSEQVNERNECWNHLTATITKAEESLTLAEKILANAEQRLADLNSSAAQSRAAAVDADRCRRLAKLLRTRRGEYMQAVWDRVFSVASSHVKQATKGWITQVSYSDGEFLFEQDGVMAPVTSASGAQRAFIGTAVRIGLGRALYGGSSLLIFDEPTEAMREANAAGLVASLSAASAQTLLITHREQDQNLAANIITIGA